MLRGCLLLVCLAFGAYGQDLSEQEAVIWASVYNLQAEIVWSMSVEADWNYNTDLTDENMNIAVMKNLVYIFDNNSNNYVHLYHHHYQQDPWAGSPYRCPTNNSPPVSICFDLGLF